jgi:hypothetical protein
MSNQEMGGAVEKAATTKKGTSVGAIIRLSWRLAKLEARDLVSERLPGDSDKEVDPWRIEM